MTCIQVGLLCVRDNAMDRPTMVDVALMLSSEKDSPNPKKPVFTMQNSSSSKIDASVTMMEGR
ncbi:non-specific serine/threonine protein kinase [Ranunculus cassubicifolius]